MLQKYSPANERDLPIDQSFLDMQKGKQDLTVLAYMARRLYSALQVQQQTGDVVEPWLTYVDERRQRAHRIVLYRPHELYTTQTLAFVGFVSKKQQALASAILDAIGEVDTRLVTELVQAPNLLSYSSLELRDGNWYNLVLLKDQDAKAHFQHSETHRYAAYQLAPRYYDWIRLHNGTLIGGLAHGCLTLQRTHHYLFKGMEAQPVMFKTVYITPGYERCIQRERS